MRSTLPEGWNFRPDPPVPLPFTLLGTGTPHVERFTSGLARLAWEHHWQPPGAFIYDRLAAALGRPLVGPGADADPGRYFSRIIAFAPASLNANGRYAATWTAATVAATGHDLRLGTLWPWGELSLSPRHLVHPGGRVCRPCLEEMLAAVRAEEMLPLEARASRVYERLLWSVSDVELCDVHETPLTAACPHCGEPLASLSYRQRPGHCGRCDGWLGGPVVSPSPDEGVRSWQRWVAAQVGHLLETSASLTEWPTGEGIDRVIARLVAEVGGLKRLGARIGRGKCAVSYWRSGRSLPTLTALLRASAVVGIDVAAALQGRWELSDAPRPIWIPIDSERHRAHDYEALELRFRRAAESQGEPPTARELLAPEGIDRKWAKKRLGRVYDDVRQRREDWIPVRRRERDLSRAARARAAGVEMATAPDKITRRSLAAHVGFSVSPSELALAKQAGASLRART